MDNKESDTPEEEEKHEKVDLTQLQSLDFGPNWTHQSKAASGGARTGGLSGDDRKRSREPGPRKDRRHGGRPERPFGRGDTEGGPRKRGRAATRESQPFEPTVDVQFLPEEEGFNAMCQAMRHSCRTYELFEIARLILAKPERYHVQVKSREKGEDGDVADLFISVPDGVPFEKEDDAVGHVMKHHLDHFFDQEIVEVEPPKGSFQYVTRCPITGELLGPPNYHRYSQILNQHHATRLPEMSFERFKASLETVRDEETVNAWLESMKTATHFTFKEEVDGERPRFDSPSEARAFLLRHCRSRVVRAAKTARFAGSRIVEMPRGNIRRSIELMAEGQQRFPLDTANALRGRLRRQKFHIYKKGSHGVSYVCAVRRQFRRPDQVFADSVQSLIEFLEANPMIHASRLPEAFLGIASAPEGDEAETGESAAGASKNAVTEDPRVKRMLVDLRWLLIEGYVTEYSDGRMFAQPPLKEEALKKPSPEKAGQETHETAELPAQESEVAKNEEESVAAPAPSEEGGDTDPAVEAPEDGVAAEPSPKAANAGADQGNEDPDSSHRSP